MMKTLPREHGHGRTVPAAKVAHPESGYLVRRARRRRRRIGGDRGLMRVLGV